MDVEKLLAAIEETERIARETAEAGGLEWTHVPCDNQQCSGHITSPRDRYLIACYPYEGGGMDKQLGEHIAHNDPAAVLRRCAADRNTVGMCEAAMRQFERGETDSSGYTLAMMVLCHLHEAYGISVEEETTQ